MQTRIAPKPAIIAGVLEAGLLYALIAGLGFSVPGAQVVQDTLKTFDIVPPAPTPPPPLPPSVVKSGRPEGAAAPAGLRAKASPIVAPPPPIPIPPPSIAAAPVAGQGTQSTQGASNVDAGGFGAGGIGNGFGSGGRGRGDGGGGGRECGGNRMNAAPCQTGGGLNYNDVSRGIDDPGEGIEMDTEFEIGPDGRVRNCEVTESSGYPAADAQTCRLIEQRFRYRPALRNGQPITSLMAKRIFLSSERER